MEGNAGNGRGLAHGAGQQQHLNEYQRQLLVQQLRQQRQAQQTQLDAQRFQQGGLQGPNFGGQQQQQYLQQQAQHALQQPQHGGLQQQIGQQPQQRQYGGQQFLTVPTHQAQGGQVGAGAQLQHGIDPRPPQNGQYAAAAQQTQPRPLIHRTVYPSAAQLQQAQMAGRHQPSVAAQNPGAAQQPVMNSTSHQFLQVPGANRIPSGGSSNSYASGPSSDGSFVQQILPRRRPGNQPDSQQPTPPASREYRAAQPQQMFQGTQAFTHRITANSGQQLSPTAAQFQPGFHQQSVSNPGNQHVQDARQISTNTQIIHPSSQQSQLGIQQRLSGSHPQIGQHVAQGQVSQGARTTNEAVNNFIQATQQNQQVQDNNANARTEPYGLTQRPLNGACEFLDELDDDGDDVMADSDALVAQEETLRQQALNRTEQWVDQTETDETNVEDVQAPEGLPDDPVYQETLHQVQQWQDRQNYPMTEDQRARLVAQETLKKKGNIKGGKRLAEIDDSDVGEDEIAEAAQNAKRQRTHGAAPRFWGTAHKIYEHGPANKSDRMTGDDESMSDAEFDHIALDSELLGLSADFAGKTSGLSLNVATPYTKPYEHKFFDPKFRLLESICCDWEFMIEVTKHLSVEDLITLYSVSKTFHSLVNLRFQSSMTAWSQKMSPTGCKIFYYKFYADLCINDPAGNIWAHPGPVDIPRPAWAAPPRAISKSHLVRQVPGFKWLSMVAQRETRTRDIIACLARSGHRLPKTMHITLKKIWHLMDAPTNRLRWAFIHNKDMWTNEDLYNAQLFYIKLQLRFNEPIFGPKSTALADTFLGVRDGLNLMWSMFRKKGSFDPEEAIQMRLRYYCRESVIQHHLVVGSSYHGLEPHELVNEHLEGWGAGKVHLFRPDELVIQESFHRGGGLEKHLIFMLFWGHVDWQKRINLVPTEEEMYISDDELPPLPTNALYTQGGMWGKTGNVPFDVDDWQPKHAMKARWKTLTPAEKLAVIKDDRTERVMALPYDNADDDFWELPYNSNDMPHPHYEGGEPPREDLNSYQVAEHQGGDEAYDAVSDADGDTWMSDADDEDGSDDYDSEEESLPIPRAITDPEIIAAWPEMDPYLQRKVINEELRLLKQDDKDDRTLAVEIEKERDAMERRARLVSEALRSGPPFSIEVTKAAAEFFAPSAPAAEEYVDPMEKKPKRYNYPPITDAVSLALLERYDRFSPADFCTGPDGKIPRGEDPAAPNSSQEAPIDYDEYDDDDLKALGDLDYSSEEGLGLGKYQKFLDRVGGDGNPNETGAAEDGAENKSNVKGKGDTMGEEATFPLGSNSSSGSSSSVDEDDSDYEVAREEDLDDDAPLPKYDFRKF